MDPRIHALALLGGFVALPHLAAQQTSQSSQVVAAAIVSVRSEFPEGGIIIDAGVFRIDSTLAAQVAAQTGATLGSARDAIHCEADGRTRRGRCTIRGGSTIVAFKEPRERGGSKEVVLTWRYQASQGNVAYKEARLLLTRNQLGDWKVDRVLARGAT